MALADFHIHTQASIDGVLSADEIVDSLTENNVTAGALTDHNTYFTVQNYWKEHGASSVTPYIDVNGVKMLSGVEVTCRVAVDNLKGNPTKVHLLVYGADFDAKSPMGRLMSIKSQNDHDVDLGLLKYFLSLNPGHGITSEQLIGFMQHKRETVNGWSGFSSADIKELFNIHGITVSTSNRGFKRLQEGAPRYQRLNIDAVDLIRIAHASGGMVVMAHPKTNLKRTVNEEALITLLIQAGIDGFEQYYNGSNRDYRTLIKNTAKKCRPANPILYTGGSDTHDMSRGNTMGHYFLHDNSKATIKTSYVAQFMDEVEALADAREKGRLTHRTYSSASLADIQDIVSGYQIRLDQTKQAQPVIELPSASTSSRIILNSATQTRPSTQTIQSKKRTSETSQLYSKLPAGYILEDDGKEL